MQERKYTAPPDRQPDRSQPIPLADRRRLVRPIEAQDDTAPVITDWASI